MKFPISLFALATLTACVSAGVKVDQSKLAEFHKGKTTYQEVVQELGKPNQTSITEDGSKTAIYMYHSAQARPENFIPIVGAFVGGADAEHSTVIMRFDKNGILKSYNSLQGSTGAGRGFEAQSQHIDYSQPRQQ